MIPSKTMKGIMEKLLKLSREDNVRWDSDFNGSNYRVYFPESSLTINFRSPETERDYYEVALLNKDDRQVGNLVIPEGDTLWDLARYLYEDATRCVAGWDKVLADLVKALDSGHPIGWPTNQTIPAIDAARGVPGAPTDSGVLGGWGLVRETPDRLPGRKTGVSRTRPQPPRDPLPESVGAPRRPRFLGLLLTGR